MVSGRDPRTPIRRHAHPPTRFPWRAFRHSYGRFVRTLKNGELTSGKMLVISGTGHEATSRFGLPLATPLEGCDAIEIRDIFHNQPPYFERRSRRRGRRVTHMDCRRTADDQEVIHEAAVGAQGLGAHT